MHERDAHAEMVELLTRYRGQLPICVIHCFTGTKEHALTYLNLGCYIGLTGYLWKDKSEDGVRKILQDNVIPLDRLLVETDAPFMYPNTRASKLPQHVKDSMTERYIFLGCFLVQVDRKFEFAALFSRCLRLAPNSNSSR